MKKYAVKGNILHRAKDGKIMKIVSSKQINFLVSNIFEKYYEPIHEELACSGLAEDLAHKVKQEILATIYRKAMDAGIETEEELDGMAVEIINERLERILVTYYAQKYVERFSLDKVSLENDMLIRIQETKSDKQPEEPVIIQEDIEEKASEEEQQEEYSPEQEQQETVEEEADTPEIIPEPCLPKETEEMAVTEGFTDCPKPSVIRRIEEPRIRRFQINWFLTILLSVTVILVLWVVVGMLMGRGYIPKLDMGYTWFNKYIWSIF